MVETAGASASLGDARCVDRRAVLENRTGGSDTICDVGFGSRAERGFMSCFQFANLLKKVLDNKKIMC